MKDCPPDLVLSGINNGENLAEDVTYSGTIAAAMEATLLGIPAISLSQAIEKNQPAKWETPQFFATEIIKKLFHAKFEENVFINVNFPNVLPNAVEGISVTSQGNRMINDNVIERIDPRGEPYYWIGPGNHRHDGIWKHSMPDTDLEAISKKRISITPLYLNLTHNPTHDLLKELFK
jgi:5'-nucleotidase